MGMTRQTSGIRSTRDTFQVSIYYCHTCSTGLGIVQPDVPESLIGTDYQLEKSIKHTAPTGIYHVNSVFADPSSDIYREYVVTATVSGSVQVDDRGRTNLLYLAGSPIGATFERGVIVTPADTIVVVFHDDRWRIHAYPAPSTGYGDAYCANCGTPLFHFT